MICTNTLFAASSAHLAILKIQQLHSTTDIYTRLGDEIHKEYHLNRNSDP